MPFTAAASIWFEIWGGCGPGSKNFDFLGEFPKNLNSFRQFHKQKIDFSGQISEKFRFFQVISQTISIFQVKFPKNFDFFQVILYKMSIFQAKIGYLQLFWGKLFYFSSKVTTFEHTSCT